MKNSHSISALIGVICGQVRIRLRLAALGSLWQNDFVVYPVFHNLSGHPEEGRRKKAELSVAAARQSAALTGCLPTAATRFDFWLFFRFLTS